MNCAFRSRLIVIATVMLAGCGGGGSPVTTSDPPTASVSDDQPGLDAMAQLRNPDALSWYVGTSALIADSAKITKLSKQISGTSDIAVGVTLQLSVLTSVKQRVETADRRESSWRWPR